MSKLQFARKSQRTAERNLRLVPDPPKAKRPKRRRWKIGRIRKPKYDHNFALHKYEEKVVLRRMIEHGGAVSVAVLTQEDGGDRWNGRYLAKTFERLRRGGYVSGQRQFSGFYGHQQTYTITEGGRKRAAAG